MASLATNVTLPRKVPPSLSLLPPALVAVTVPPLALLALLKLFLAILTLLALMVVRTLMALPETSLSMLEISRPEPLMIPLLGTLVALSLPLNRLCPTGTMSSSPALMAGLSRSLALSHVKAVILAMEQCSVNDIRISG